MEGRSLRKIDLKIVVLGPSGAGKTSIINRYCNNVFIQDTRSTIGAGFYERTVQIDETEASVMIWDTAGEERFRSVAPALLRGTNGLILVFDMGSTRSFREIDDFLTMFVNVCQVNPGKPYPVMLLGNKCDLDMIDVYQEMVDIWMHRHKVTMYHKVSAKTGKNIDDAFDELIQFLINPINKNESVPIQIVLASPEQKNQCC